MGIFAIYPLLKCNRVVFLKCYTIISYYTTHTYTHTHIYSFWEYITNNKQIQFLFLVKQISTYIINVISVALLEARCGETHPTDPPRYIGDVQVVLVILESVSLSANYFTQKIHFIYIFSIYIIKTD